MCSRSGIADSLLPCNNLVLTVAVVSRSLTFCAYKFFILTLIIVAVCHLQEEEQCGRSSEEVVCSNCRKKQIFFIFNCFLISLFATCQSILSCLQSKELAR